MRKSLLAATVAGVATLGFWASPSIAQDDTDQKFGTVHFATSCNETAQRRFDRAMRYQHSFWYKASREIFEETLKADPTCGIAYWGMALGLLDNPHNPIPAPNLPLGLAAIQAAKATGAKTQRERDFIDALAVMYVDYDKTPAWGARSVLPQGDGSAGRKISRRRRGTDLLRDYPERRGLADRQDLRQSTQGSGHPGGDQQAAAPAPGCRSLSHSPL